MAKRVLYCLFVILLFAACGTYQNNRTKVKPLTTKSGKIVVVKGTGSKTGQAKKESAKSNATTNTQKKSEVLEATSKVKVTTEVVNDYIERFKDIAIKNMRDYKIPASITLGQGILESGAGTGSLSILANNHFGIKCHKEWKGPSVSYDDDTAGECFRKYDEASESYRDHSIFLTTRSRYAALFKLEIADYQSWARGLKEAGYATDPKYPEKLITIIERYNLDRFDAAALGIDYNSKNQFNNDQLTSNDYYQVVQGDTLYSISKRFGISIDDLRRINNISENSISIGQRLRIR